MAKIVTLFLFLFSFSLYACGECDARRLLIKKQIENRWQAFQQDKEFIPFEEGRSDADLQREFEGIREVRFPTWKMFDYAFAGHLVEEDLVRSKECVAFSYNNTTPYYNASTIFLGDRRYIACEGPREKDVPAFFRLLTAQKVTHLVRLTDSHEGEFQKCHPYWEGIMKDDYLQIPGEMESSQIHAFDLAGWKDNQGVDPDALLTLVLQVKEAIAEEGSHLAVHCSAGVGRTGTFLAALAIVDAIDRGESFSIQEIVYRLSLQRIHSVAQIPQYITLYRLAEHYLKKINA